MSRKISRPPEARGAVLMVESMSLLSHSMRPAVVNLRIV